MIFRMIKRLELLHDFDYEPIHHMVIQWIDPRHGIIYRDIVVTRPGANFSDDFNDHDSFFAH